MVHIKKKKKKVFKNTGSLTVGTYIAHRVHMPFPFVKVKNTNNLCDCEMTMSLGSRNLGYAGITKPSRVCDNSIVHNSAE